MNPGYPVKTEEIIMKINAYQDIPRYTKILFVSSHVSYVHEMK